MDGYKTCNWMELQKAIMDSWGELDNTILYTPNDLLQLASEYSKNGGNGGPDTLTVALAY